nr:MAG: casein kinase 1-like protein 5/major virion DNA-binding protein [Diabrotica toursvirus 3a]
MNKDIFKIELGTKLGAGGYGIVYKFKDNLAVKVETRKDEHSSLKNEWEFYKKFSAEFLPSTFIFYETKLKSYLVMELLTPYSFTLESVNEILNILSWLNDNKLCHGDIKFSNFMIKESNVKRIMLIDFGFVKKYGDEEKNRFGTPLFMSRNSHRYIYNWKNDIESFGLNMYDFFYKLPWEGMTINKYFRLKVQFFNGLVNKKYKSDSMIFITKFLLLISKSSDDDVPDYSKFKYPIKSE